MLGELAPRRLGRGLSGPVTVERQDDRPVTGSGEQPLGVVVGERGADGRDTDQVLIVVTGCLVDRDGVQRSFTHHRYRTGGELLGVFGEPVQDLVFVEQGGGGGVQVLRCPGIVDCRVPGGR